MSASYLERLYCRTFQMGMKLVNYAIPYRMPQYRQGAGSLPYVPQILRAHGVKHPLIVTDEQIVKLGLLQGLLDILTKADIAYSVDDKVSANPTSDDVEAGYLLYREEKADSLIGFGGGSPLDCAKAIGAKVVRPNKSPAQLQGILKVGHDIPFFIAVPTTAGTGSETTLAAVITDSRTHHKASINDPHLIPNYAILEPGLTVGLPPKITAMTGMDALCHAIESYTNHIYNTPLENFLAEEAVRLIYENLETAYAHGDDLQARGNMQKAAFYAGRAFTRGCVGYVHAVGHTLGGLYGVPHGLAMSILLPHVLRQYGAAVERRLAKLASICNMEGASDHEQAKRFIDWIAQMNKRMNIPDHVEGIQDGDIPQIIRWAMAEANPLYPTPVVWGRKDFEVLLRHIRGKA